MSEPPARVPKVGHIHCRLFLKINVDGANFTLLFVALPLLNPETEWRTASARFTSKASRPSFSDLKIFKHETMSPGIEWLVINAEQSKLLIRKYELTFLFLGRKRNLLVLVYNPSCRGCKGDWSERRKTGPERPCTKFLTWCHIQKYLCI